jgi:hypothetical protein
MNQHISTSRAERFAVGVVIALGLIALAAPSARAQPEPEDPYAPLPLPTEQTQPQTAEPSNILNPNISAIGTFAFGYLSDDWLQPAGHDPSRTGANLQEVEFGFQAAVDPYFRTDIFLTLSEHGFELEEGTLKTLALPTGLQIELGQLLAEMGRHNTRHLETWEFVDNPLPNRLLLGGHGLSGLGGELSYIVPTGTRTVYLRLVGQLFDTHTLDLSGEGHAHEHAEDAGEAEEHADEHSDTGLDDLRVAALGRIESAFTFNPAWTLMLGLSSIFGPSGEHGDDYDTRIYGADLYLRYRQTGGEGYHTVALTVEGMRREHYHEGEETISDQGLYTTLFYRFARRWDTAARFEAIDGESLSDPLRGSLQLSFSPSEFSRLRLQYGALLPDDDADLEHLGMLQVEFSIGPHGAHPF